MDDIIKPFWLDMSEARLQRHLVERKYPAPIMRDIIVRVRQMKAARKKSRIKATVTQQMWDDILRAARIELAGVRTMKAQIRAADPDGFDTGGNIKFKALTLYGETIAETIEKLRKLRAAGDQTPKQFVEYIMQTNGREIPNEGRHWTDYVSQRRKQQVLDLFSQAPVPRRGKQKALFERKVSPEENAITRGFLVGQMNTARTETQAQLEVATDPDQIAQLERVLRDLHLADYKLEIATKTAFLPAKWRGLLGM